MMSDSVPEKSSVKKSDDVGFSQRKVIGEKSDDVGFSQRKVIKSKKV